MPTSRQSDATTADDATGRCGLSVPIDGIRLEASCKVARGG
jgi:hypothetical protein